MTDNDLYSSYQLGKYILIYTLRTQQGIAFDTAAVS
jgi:hypothetical protein